MIILVTGAKGLLGTAFCKVLQKSHQVIPLDIGELDVTLPDTANEISNFSPDIVCHLAAYTDVDGCEKNSDKAFRVNGLGTKNVALGAKKAGVPLLYLSTDYLFDGKKKEPYREDDQPNPLNVYGKSKLEGEKTLTEVLQEYYIVRSSWLYGEGGRNFVRTILRLSGERKVLEVVDDQVGTPTYTKDLSEGLKRLIERRSSGDTAPFGVYHITNSGSCSWYDFAAEILEISGVDDCRLERTNSENFPRPAGRPPYSVLDNGNFKNFSGFSLRSWKDAVNDFLKNQSDIT
jgi:dTDP-4-dehydrorhamnose reductase